MKLWVDDPRAAPIGWNRATNVSEVKIIFTQHYYRGRIEGITDTSLDHDTGDYSYLGDYIVILNWLEKHCTEDGWDVSNINFHIHTTDPKARVDMERIIRKNGWRLI